jgi:hypothetical protein
MLAHGSTVCLASIFLAVASRGLAAHTEVVHESARAIPVACQVDVVVVGGSTGAVSAAVAAAKAGARVFLAAERPYLGDDMTATLRLWPQPDDERDPPLAGQLFADPQNKVLRPAGAAASPPRPMYVKRMLDEALLTSGVQYLYSCFPTDVLRDAQGRPSGIVMANRAGRQAVIARSIVDATQRAVVARLAGARFRPYPAGMQTMKYVVIGGRMHSGQAMTARIAAEPFRGPFPNRAKTSSGEFQVIEYTLQVPMAGDTDTAWAAAEQLVRSKTYDPEQQFTSDALVQVPPDPVVARKSDASPWRGSQRVPLDALRPAEVSDLYVLGACADISRTAADRLLGPGALIALGARVGQAAAQDATRRTSPVDVRLPGVPAPGPTAEGVVCESLAGVRPGHGQPTIEQSARALPVLGRFDVVVVGGGTSGAPAAIAAARQGAKTLVVEQHHGLGGMGTLGTVAGYFFGNRCGFTATVGGGANWVIEQKMQWWREELLKAGGQVWFGCVGCGAFVHNGRVCGAVVATPRGRGVVLAKVVVDTTGSADIAAAAGGQCVYTDRRDVALAGAGVPPRNLGATEGNVDYCIVDETDMVDVWHLYVYAKDKHPKAFDQGVIIDTRERRRSVGDYTLTILDELNARTYPDTIAVAHSIFDYGPTQCYPIDPAFLAMGDPGETSVDIPYRCCLPKGLDGILVAAVGLSADHDALPMIRMQADLQNLGYAVGVASAMTARSGTSTRGIDLRALQRHLVEIENVPRRVLTDKDSYPISSERLARAVRELSVTPQNATLILAQPEQSLPLLRDAYTHSEGRTRLTYARLLGILGDPLGVDALIGAVRGYRQWDKGWNFRWRSRQLGPRPLLSPLDQLIITLGRAGDRRAVPVIVEKVRLLTADDDFSHHRAVVLALESLADRAAARPLAELLAKPLMSGHVHAPIEVALQRAAAEVPHGLWDSGYQASESRRESLRELMLARALYRCGDHERLGETTLRRYAEDLRGHLARHAQAVLASGAAKR